MDTTSKLFNIGSIAPDFTLRIGNGILDNEDINMFKLSNQRGKNTILAFYPADWSSVCSSQISLYNELIPEFQSYNAELFGISVDGTFCHKAFKDHNNIHLTLLCDFEPKGMVSKLYGVYDDTFGTSQRAIYVLDKDGVVQYSYLSPIDVNPGAKEILETLKKLKS